MQVKEFHADAPCRDRILTEIKGENGEITSAVAFIGWERIVK